MPQIIEVPGMGRVEFPDGMSDGDIVKAIQSNGQTATDRQQLQASKPARAVQGVRDFIDGGTQLLVNSLPEGVVSGVNKATQFVNNLPVIGPATVALGMTPASKQDINSGITQNEKEYQAARAATGNTGFDWMRTGGNVAAVSPLAAALPVGASLGARAALGAGSGALFNSLNPVIGAEEKGLWPEKGKQAGIGALTGGIAAPILGAAASAVNPKVRPEVKMLQEAGITPTPGQILGGAAQRTEEKLASLPVLGDAIKSSQTAAINDLNKAVYGRALNPIGGEVPKTIGREAVSDVSNQLSKAYDDLLPKLSFKADKQFATEFNNVVDMAGTLPQAEAAQFKKIMQEQVIKKMTKSGLASGETIKQVESELGRLARGYKGEQSFDKRQLGSAIEEVQRSIRETLGRANPQYADELAKINEGYANYAILRNAASRAGAKEGVLTPAQLSAAVRSSDRSVGKGNFARGRANMQDLSDAAVNVLGQKYPDSGSIGRLAMGGAVIGSGAANPIIPGLLMAGSLPYLPVGRQIAAGLLTKRPELAQPIAEGIRRVPGGLLGPAAYQLTAD